MARLPEVALLYFYIAIWSHKLGQQTDFPVRSKVNNTQPALHLHFDFWWLMKMFLIWAMKEGRSAAEEGLQWEIPLEEVFICIPSLTRQGWQPDHGKMLGGPLILNCLGQRLPVTGSDGDKK